MTQTKKTKGYVKWGDCSYAHMVALALCMRLLPYLESYFTFANVLTSLKGTSRMFETEGLEDSEFLLQLRFDAGEFSHFNIRMKLILLDPYGNPTKFRIEELDVFHCDKYHGKLVMPDPSTKRGCDRVNQAFKYQLKNGMPVQIPEMAHFSVPAL
jgi:hypothetical protein